MVHLKRTLKMQLLGPWPGTAASETRLRLCQLPGDRDTAWGTSALLPTILDEGQHKTTDLPEKRPSVRNWKEPLSE